MSGNGPTRKPPAKAASRLTIDTTRLPAAQQFDLYKATLGDKWDSIRAIHNPANGFRFVFENLDLPGLDVRAYERAASELERTAAQARKDGNDRIVVSVMIDGHTLTESDDVELQLGPGTLLINDLTRPRRARTSSAHAAAIDAPRETIAAMVGDPAALHNQVRHTVVAKLFCDHLVSLCRHMDAAASTPTSQIAEMTEHMLAAALAPTRDNMAIAAKPIGDLLRRRVMRYIDRRLLDPDLTPDSVALALGVSRRTLYRTFEADGGVARQIQARRLDHAHEILLDSSALHRIKTIAYSHNFGSESHFARSFKRRFGYNPSEAADLAWAKAAVL